MRGRHNGRATARDNKGQNTDKTHTLSPRIDIKMYDPARNRIRAVLLEGRSSTDHATERTLLILEVKNSGFHNNSDDDDDFLIS